MRLQSSISVVAIATVLLSSLVGCGENQANEPARAPETTSGAATLSNANGAESTSNATTQAMAHASANAAGVADTSTARTSLSSADTETSLNDMRIAQITDTANSGEVEQGRYAALHATNARVKAFAQHMVSAHTAIGQKMTAVLHKEGIIPAVSAESTKLGAGAQETLASLKTMTGSDFDKAYIDAQVKAHQEVLDALDNKLIPNAQDASLKVNLQQIRPMVAEHLKEAQDIQKTLEAH
jgi:putative membrane protein